MINIIKEFLLQFFNPLAFVGLVLFVSLFLIKKKAKTAIWFIAICLAIVTVFGNPYFSTFLTRSMEWRYMPEAEYEQADAIILFADGTYSANTPRQRVEVGEGADRVLYAAQLYQKELAPIIVVSGNVARSTSTKTLLMELGVPEEAILLDHSSPNMRASAHYISQIIEIEEFKNVILVQSALKMDRTLFLLNDLDLNISVAPVDYKVTLQDWQDLTSWQWQDIIANLMPSVEAFEQSWQALWEYFGLAFYRVRAIF
ncbi:MAG: YdcF family protein [Anaerolineaceae bacterium]|jgi:uncharacterized SAM-binding protein YcdF (DUF218 family)